MTVPMMRVRVMVMRVSERLVPVMMSVSSSRCDGGIMLMLVVRILAMDVFVLVFERFVNMLVFVTLSQMEPHTARHQCSSG